MKKSKTGCGKRVSGLVVAAALALSPVVSFAGDIQQGEWEIGMTMRVPSAPTFEPPATTLVKCMRPGAPSSDFFDGLPGGGGAPNCAYVAKETVGSVFRFVMRCTGKPSMESRGEINVSSTSVQGEIRTTTTMDNFTSEVVTTLSAKYLGSCKRF